MKKSFIPLTALALFALVSCSPAETPTSSSESETVSSSEQVVVNSVTISNKEALTAEWYVGGTDRTIEIALDPAGNITSLINSGALTITSSDATVVSVTGKYLKALKVGTATITVAYGGKSDSVAIEVKAEKTAIDLYGTVHAGTLADPLDNEDALKVAEKTGSTATEKYFYIKGTVSGFTFPAGTSAGYATFYLTPAEGKTAKFLGYKVKGKDAADLTESDIWVGAEVVIKDKIVNYTKSGKTTAETNGGGELISATGTKTTVATHQVSVADAVTAALAISENNLASVDKYEVTGYVTGVYGAWDDSYKNMSVYMSDTMDDPNATFIAFQAAMASNTDHTKIVAGAKIKVTCYLTKYNTTPETIGSSSATIELLNETPGADVVASIAANSISVGNTSQITVTEQTGVTFTYASSDDAVATVDANGLVTGVAAGKATITVTASTGRKDYIKVTIVEGEVVDTSITVARAKEIAGALDNQAKTEDSYDIVGYVVKVTYAYSSSNKTISFTMSDEMDDLNASFVAFKVTVESDVAKKIVAGAKVKVSSKLTKYGSTLETVGGTDTTAIVMNAPTGADVVASMGNGFVDKNGTATINVTAQDGVTFTYSSSDETIATVSIDGVVKGEAKGTATITIAASTGRKAYLEVEVIDANEKAVTWTVSGSQSDFPSGDNYGSATISADFGGTTISLSATSVKNNSGALILQKNTGFVYSTTAMPGAIKSLTIQTPTDSAGTATYAAHFGTAALSTLNGADDVNIGKGAKHKFTCNVDGAKYFNISAGDDNKANGQLAFVTIVYTVNS